MGRILEFLRKEGGGSSNNSNFIFPPLQTQEQNLLVHVSVIISNEEKGIGLLQ